MGKAWKQVLEEAQMREALTANKRAEQGEVKSLLDKLRATRAARGGTGAPLAVPGHLRDAAAGMGIIVTDRDVDEDAALRTREEIDDENSDRAAAINRSEREDE